MVGEVVPPKELEDDLALAPASGPSAEEIRRSLQTTEPVEIDDEEGLPEPSLQFSLRDMMLVTFLAALGFAVLRFCPPPMFAGAMGGIAILGLALLTIAKPEKAIFHLIWWTVLGVYIIASIIAVISKK